MSNLPTLSKQQISQRSTLLSYNYMQAQLAYMSAKLSAAEVKEDARLKFNPIYEQQRAELMQQFEQLDRAYAEAVNSFTQAAVDVCRVAHESLLAAKEESAAFRLSNPLKLKAVKTSKSKASTPNVAHTVESSTVRGADPTTIAQQYSQEIEIDDVQPTNRPDRLASAFAQR
jgi:hypothetical protein